MKNIISYLQLLKESDSPVFHAVFLRETGDLLAFFDEISFADAFMQDEMLSGDAIYDIEEHMREEGRSEEDEDWDQEIETRLHELMWEVYTSDELDLQEIIEHLKLLRKEEREYVYHASDSMHLNKRTAEKIIRGKEMFGV